MSNTKNTYYRNFLIFEKEDPGFGDGAEPTGYIKLEGREGKGKLLASVQNLKEDSGKVNYKLYMIYCTDKIAFTVYVGNILLQRGRGELKWDYDADNVAQTGVPVFDFNVAVITAETGDKANRKLFCPLVAYKGDKVDWRGKALQNIYPASLKKIEYEEEILQKKDIYQHKETNYEPENIVPENYSKMEDNTKTEDYPAEESSEKQKNTGTEDNFSCPQAHTNSVNPCENCYAKNLHSPGNNENVIVQDIEKLKRNFDKCFVIFDPFNSKRRDYRWWKVDSPVNLNNLLYQSNIRSPLLFNPIVMMAHFKFRHLAIGIYSDRLKSREYLVCGVPGVFGIDTKPFGDMCKWIQLEGDTHRYGAFGYWIVFIDPKSGKFLSL